MVPRSTIEAEAKGLGEWLKMPLFLEQICKEFTDEGKATED